MEARSKGTNAILPNPKTLRFSRSRLIQKLPGEGVGEAKAMEHVQDVIVPCLNNSSLSPYYYGFVTGGATAESRFADNIVTEYDQNVQVHLPNETISTNVEDAALRMICNLLKFDSNCWTERTFTTGATASNILGLAAAREHLISLSATENGFSHGVSVGERGLLNAMKDAQLDSIQILSSMPHSSISKAASVVGLGRSSVKSIGSASEPWWIDFEKLESLVQEPRTASIIAISCGEVNTGRFATDGHLMERIIQLRNRYRNVWIHVDGAFGIMGRILENDEFRSIVDGCAGIENADSITGDCHKLLNVPYDCGFFLCRKAGVLHEVFNNPGAAYLANSLGPDRIQSPLNIGIENSRRFRALPVYTNLVSYGLHGFMRMLERQIHLTRAIAEFIQENEFYELLPKPSGNIPEKQEIAHTFIVVLFRAKNDRLNFELANRIKAQRQIYVSGTSWNGSPACRFAISNWQASVERDMPIIKSALVQVAKSSLDNDEIRELS